MDRTQSSADRSGPNISGSTDDPDRNSKPEVESDSWGDLTEFVDQFDDRVFGVFANPDDGPEGFWIVKRIDKIRPSAVPIEQGSTFKMDVLGSGGKAVNEIRLTIEEIDHVRAAEPSGVSPESDDE